MHTRQRTTWLAELMVLAVYSSSVLDCGSQDDNAAGFQDSDGSAAVGTDGSLGGRDSGVMSDTGGSDGSTRASSGGSSGSSSGASGSGGSSGSSGSGSGSSGGSSSGASGSGSGGMDASGGADANEAGGTSPEAGTLTTPGKAVFSPNVRLNDDTGTGQEAEVALAAGPGGLALAGWMDSRSSQRVCAYTFSTDGGLTWSPNVFIPNMGGVFVGDPSVAIDADGTMYAVCQDYQNSMGTAGNILMMTSSDKGKTWSAPSSIQSAPDKPWAGAGGDNATLFVSWLGNPGGLKRSTDHGNTWGPIQSLGNIVHGTGITTSSSGLVHVPFNLDSSMNQLRYLRSKDHGQTYDAYRDLIPNMGTFCFSCSPRQHPIVGAAADPTGKIVAITWSSTMSGGDGDDDVWLLYSNDGGDTWSMPIRVNDNTTPSRQFQSWVAVDAGGWVHVAWTDFRDGGTDETWYARSADPTKGFEPNIQVTDGSGSGNQSFLGDYKGIAVSGSDVLVAWQDTRNDSGDIYFSRAAGAASGVH